MAKVFWSDEGDSVETKFDLKRRPKKKVILKKLGANEEALEKKRLEEKK